MPDPFAALVYGLAAWSVYRALHRSWRGELAWALCVVALMALALDRQFAVLDSLTNMVRALAWQEAWYWERAPLQQGLVVGIALGAFVAVAVVLNGLQRHSWQLRLTVFATMMLVTLALIKAVSLHGLDALFIRPVWASLPLHLTLGSSLTLIGIGAVFLASLAVPPVGRGPAIASPHRRH